MERVGDSKHRSLRGEERNTKSLSLATLKSRELSQTDEGESGEPRKWEV
jgi:hypothetical protein